MGNPIFHSFVYRENFVMFSVVLDGSGRFCDGLRGFERSCMVPKTVLNHFQVGVALRSLI